MSYVRHVAPAAALVAILAAFMVVVSAPQGPTTCEAAFSPVRCSNMTDYAAWRLGVRRDEIIDISVLPPPTPETRFGVTILHTYSGGGPVETLVTLGDGGVHMVSMDCGGIPELQCQDAPQLRATSVTHGGYFDTPCAATCATPVPSPEPQALAAAVALRVARLDIPIDHDGRYEVPAGKATLPNGLLSVADFDFVSPDWPSDVVIADGIVTLEVRSLDDPARAFANVHEHGRVAGVERVEAILVFVVRRHEKGAVLSIRDLVVR